MRESDGGAGTFDEELLWATRNPKYSKRLFRAYQMHYDPANLKLASDAPLHVNTSNRIELSTRSTASEIDDFERILLKRESCRQFSDKALKLTNLYTLLRTANGVRAQKTVHEERFYKRPAPNSGNLGSVEIYTIVLNVNGIPPGIYHFDTIEHVLSQIRAGDFREWLRQHVIFQTVFTRAAALLVLTVAFGRLRAKYGQKAFRMGFLDAGHVSQNIYLCATYLELGVSATLGFVDDELDKALEIDGLETASVLVIAVGPKMPSDK
jgi:SagB-type dehydrogenase family enzyme